MRGLINGKTLLGAALLAFLGVAGWIVASDEQGRAQAGATEVAALPESEAPKLANAPAAEAPPAPKPTPDLSDPFVIKRVLPISGPIKYGEWHWDDTNVPDGELVITVDLEARVISVFRDGYEIGAAAVLLGTEEKPTPTGIFPITQKKRHHVSNLYDAPMPYMQRLTDDGITLHATTVEWGYASHGCIGMPEPFAAKVFAQTHLGDRVFITRGKMVQLGDSLVDS